MTLDGLPGMTEFQLDLPLRGGRSYVHGTDIVQQIMEWIKSENTREPRYLSGISFFSSTGNQLLATFDTSNFAGKATGSFLISSEVTSNKIEGYLIDTGVPATSKLPYDEEDILKFTEFSPSGSTALVRFHSGYLPIQGIVAATKTICLAASPTGGKWLFGSLALNKPLPSSIRSLNLALEKIVMDRLAVVALDIDDIPIGTIRFIKEVP